jgi:hypothetical protein
MNEVLLGGPPSAVRDLHEFQPVAFGQAADAQISVEDEKPAVILDRLLWRGLAQPIWLADIAPEVRATSRPSWKRIIVGIP